MLPVFDFADRDDGFMPDMQQFTADTLPDHLGWQIHDFIRIHWFDIFAYEADASIDPATWHPTYFVIAEQRALYSAAAVVWQDIDIEGDTYRAYGLSGVLTYPAFRKKGYGQRVVTAATDFIKGQADADLAFLWTTTTLEAFYNRTGWAHPKNIVVTAGDPDSPAPTNYPMLMFLSARARQLESSLAGNALYFGPCTW